MTRASDRLIVVAAVVASLVVMSAVVLPIFIRARSTSAQNACINNLGQIEGAKQQWALENKKIASDVPSWADVQAYLGRGTRGEIPKCPQGGTYILGRVGESPGCSIGGPSHSLPP